METIADRIKKRRLELGLSQDELAKRVGYKDRSSISYIEDGKKELKQSMIVKMAEELKTTPSYLMDGYDVEAIYNQIKSMDAFDRMILINRLNKDFEQKRTLHDMLMEEHSTQINIQEAKKIIDDVLSKEPKKVVKVGMPKIGKNPTPEKA